MPDGAEINPANPAVLAERLSLRYHPASARMYEPPKPIFSRRARGSRGWQEDDEEDVEGDDDDELVPEEAPIVVGEAGSWALRDVSFAIPEGRAVGIVGAPGSGKTVLLRVLAGGTPPTSGRALLRGRVSPLAEISALFMTTADAPAKNIGGALLAAGYPKALAREHLREILEFAEIPSQESHHGPTRSMRGLSLAATLNAGADTVLLVDPVVVGPDVRARALELVERRHAEGATILLESSDLGLVHRLCSEVLWLEAGRVVDYGPASEVLGAYAAAQVDVTAAVRPPLRSFNHLAALTGISARTTEPALLELELELELASAPLEIAAVVELRPEGGNHTEATLRIEQPDPLNYEETGFHRLVLSLDQEALMAGSYVCGVELSIEHAGAGATIGRTNALVFQVASPGAPSADLRPEWELSPGRA